LEVDFTYQATPNWTIENAQLIRIIDRPVASWLGRGQAPRT
jgi:hypothetical protein